MKMKKVLFVATVVQKHINVFHLPFLKMFQEEGYTTFVAASNDTKQQEVSIPYCDQYVEIEFKRNPFHPGNIPAYKKLRKLINDNEFDIIHCHTPVGGVLGRLAASKARKKGTRVFYTAHGFHFYKGAPLKNWLLYYPVEWLCAFFTDTLITINKEDYALAQKHMHAKRVEYVPGVGIDVEKFANTTVDKKAKRSELGIPEDAKLLISVGEVSKRKNHKVILEALAKIEDTNVHYMVVGEGPLKDELQKYAIEKKIAGRVHFLGYRKDIAELYKISDVCCFPSIHEGLPVALMEAMACGLPVVCSKIRGNVDLVTEQNGFLVDLRNKDEYLTSLLKVLQKDDYWIKLGRTNIDKVKEFSQNIVLKKVFELYEI